MGFFLQKDAYKTLGKLSVSVVIVAAGKSTRMNMETNKQFIEVGGLPVLAGTLLRFENCRYVDEIILVVNEKDIIYCKSNIVDLYDIRKVKVIAAGGLKRQDSVYNGLLEVDKSCDVVLVHDGARPFVKENTIIENIAAACEYGAVCTAVPVKDTIKSADESGFVADTPDRRFLWSVQTPQTFKYSIICESYKKAREEALIGTDDAVLAEKAGYKVKLVMGSYDNIKITTQEDLVIGEAIAGNQA